MFVFTFQNISINRFQNYKFRIALPKIYKQVKFGTLVYTRACKDPLLKT